MDIYYVCWIKYCVTHTGHHTDDVGCLGDVSESDDYTDWLHEFDTAQPCLPKFWLIMEVKEKKVEVFFHCRY